MKASGCGFFSDGCLFARPRSHPSASESAAASLAFASVPTRTQHVGALCMQNKSEHSETRKKLARGAESSLKLKARLPHLALVPGTRKGGGGAPKCRAEEETERRVRAVIFTAGKSHWLFFFFYLPASIRRHPAGKVGGLEGLRSSHGEREWPL